MLTRILIILIVLLLLPAWGIDRCWPKRRLRGKRRLIFYIVPLVLSLLMVLTAIDEQYTPEADRHKALLISAALLVIVPQVVLCLFLLLAKGLERRWAKGSVAAIVMGGLSCIAVFCAIFYVLTAGYRHFVIREATFQSAKLPQAFDGYRIVQLSDLHLGTLHGRTDVVEDIVQRVNALKPDLIVFTGDLVNYRASEADEFMETLSRLKSQDGVVSVMGNHDYAQYFHWTSPADSLADIRHLQETQRRMGWKLLLNAHTTIVRGTDTLAVVGVENQGHAPFPALADLPKATKGLSPATFVILLSHDPTHWRDQVEPDTDIPLTLSGHTHGMQLKIGSFSPASWFYKDWGGAYDSQDGQTLYVSLGIGSVLVPFRFGAWPEINLITLRKRSTTSHN